MEKQYNNRINLIFLHQFTLVVLALLVNGLFLWHYDTSYFFAVSNLHGNIGYNLARHNSYNLNSSILQYCNTLKKYENRLIDYAEIPNINLPKKQTSFPINDTIGYGILLGLLWKLTGSLRFIHVQFLQIFIYAFLILLLYKLIFLIFCNPFLAFYCCIAQLLFFPLIWLNVQPVRDIWAYYGLLFLVYGILQFLLRPREQKSFLTVTLCSIIFSICQFIRPTVFLALITLSILSFCYALYRGQIKKILYMLLLVWAINILFFWFPFCAYNIQTYNRWFVAPVGQDLLEGLGEFENPWNYHLCDRWLADYIGKKYNVIYGTPEFDDSAKTEFYSALHENPTFYVHTLIKRIPQIIFPGLPWIFTHNKNSYYLILSRWYIRLFLLLGYIGFVYAFVQKKYFFLGLVFAILFAGLGKLPSHIEYRYLIPFYWAFSFGVGILLHKSDIIPYSSSLK